MRRNLRKTNNNIMFGIVALAIMVLLVVLLFWVLCLPDGVSLIPTSGEG